METIIDKKFQDEPNVEASVWMDKISKLKNENKILLDKMQCNATEKKRLEKLLYSKYKIRFLKTKTP